MLNTIDDMGIGDRLDHIKRKLRLARLACYGIDEVADNHEGSLVGELLFEIEKVLSKLSADIRRTPGAEAVETGR